MSWRESPLSRSHSPALRALAERLGQPTVQVVARQPGTTAVYRVTAHYHDRRAHDSVATLRRANAGPILLECYFDHALNQRPLTLTMTLSRFEALTRALIGLGFDHLGDQPQLPAYDVANVWLLERAAGTFVHALLLAPALAAADSPHGKLAAAIREHMPELVREIPVSAHGPDR